MAAVSNNTADVANNTTNITDAYYNNYQSLKEIAFIYRILHYVVGSLGFLLNIGTFVAIVCKKASNKLQLKFLASLSVSDMVLAFLSGIYYDICFPNVWQGMGPFCFSLDFNTTVMLYVNFILSHVYAVSQFSGVFTLYAITIDILCATSRPLYYRHCHTRCNGAVVVVSVWVISISIVVTETVISNSDFQPTRLAPPVYSSGIAMMFSAFSFLPFCIMYTIILCNIRRHVTNTVSSTQTRTISKAVKTMLMIIGSYFVCMMPAVWTIILVMNSSELDIGQISSLFNGFHVLYIFNTVLDPIIYAIRIPEVRNSFGACFRQCCRKTPRRVVLNKGNTCTSV